MADLWWGLNSWNVVDYCGFTANVPVCCLNPYPTLPNAMDAKSCWVHTVDHIHWGTFDLGGLALIKWLRGASYAGALPCGGNPWFVDVYISGGEVYGDWQLVASNINTWRLGCYWQEVDCLDAIGRYVLVEITECQWYVGQAYLDYLRWGTPNCSGLDPPFHHAYIFDVFGDWFTPTPIYLGGQAICTSSVGAAELTGIAQHLSSTTGGMLDTLGDVSGTAKHLSGETGGLLGVTGILRDQFRYLKGEINITSSVVATGGELNVSVSIHGSTIGVSDASAVLEFAPFTELVAAPVLSGTTALGVLIDASARLTGTIDIQSTVAGELTVPERFTGAIGIQSSLVGELTVTGTKLLTGTVTSIATVGGELSGITRSLTGVITAQSSAFGKISVIHTGPIPIYLTGTITCQSTVGGELAGMTREFAVTVAATSSTSGVLVLTKGLASTITCNSSCVGSLTTRTFIEGTVTSSVLMSGVLKTTRSLVGVVSSQSTVSAELSLVEVVFLDGQVTASSNIIGVLKVAWKLAATISSESICSGSMSTAQKLTGSMEIQSVVNGLLERDRSLAGALACVSTLTCDYLSLEKTITVVANFTSIVTGNLIKAGELKVIITSVSTVSGNIELTSGLSGAIAVISTVSGIIHYRVPRFVIADARILPIFTCTIVISSTLESSANNQPVLAHAVRASPIFTFMASSLPIFTHSTRVNEKLKLLTV